MDIEKIRASFRPCRIDVLFVGESAPTAGTFFYKHNSSAFHEMRKAFNKHFARSFGCDEFLDWFKERNCFLDDLVLKPVDKMDPKARKAACHDGIPKLASRIAHHRPKSVVAIAKKINNDVKEALRLSRVEATYDCISFPGHGQQGKFQNEMERLLRKLPISA